MVKKHSCASVCNGLPTLSANHPWLVDHNLLEEEDERRDHILYTMWDPFYQQRCRVPSFLGRRIQGCFYGWVILSNHPHNHMWSLWNPVTSRIIRLPRLIMKNEDRGSDFTQQCCLSSPPDDHGSIFMLTTKRQAIVYCRVEYKRKRLKWVEMSYARQMRSMWGMWRGYDGVLCSLTSCNGKVYALNSGCPESYVIQVNIKVKRRKVVISLLPYTMVPMYYMNGCVNYIYFLYGCCTELFYIELGLIEVSDVTKETVGGVCVFRLDFNKKRKRWKMVQDLKDAAFFLDLAHGNSVFYNPAVASGLGGGYVHFLDRSGKVINSYNLKKKTISLSSMPTSHTTSLLERRLLQGDQGEIKFEDKETEMAVRDGKSRLLNIPFDVLKMIVERCVGVEYLNFRATCKQCHMAAPPVRWSKGGRLQAYSLVSPWLMVLHKDRGFISFMDPMSGDEYFMKKPHWLLGDLEIDYSMCGWLLIRIRRESLMFFNPFTRGIRMLPRACYLDTYCFSAPPTSSDCMVVGFTTRTEWHVYIHFVARERVWRRFRLNSFCGDGLHSIHFATLYGQNLYALYNNGGLGFIYTGNGDYTWRKVLAEGPRSSCGSPKENFLVKCEQWLLLVIVGEFGESVEVFKLNDSTEWEKMESLGRHAIYIGGKTCLCIEAKTPVMANKIYFPRVHSKNKKIVFYSLETRQYHTSNIDESFGDFMGTEHHLDPHVWIEPNWT